MRLARFSLNPLGATAPTSVLTSGELIVPYCSVRCTMTQLSGDTPLSAVVTAGLKVLGEHTADDASPTLIVYRADHKLYRVRLKGHWFAGAVELSERIEAVVKRLSPLAVALVSPFIDPIQLSLPGSAYVALAAEDIDRECYCELAEVGEDGELTLLGRDGQQELVSGSHFARMVSRGVGYGVFG